MKAGLLAPEKGATAPSSQATPHSLSIQAAPSPRSTGSFNVRVHPVPPFLGWGWLAGRGRVSRLFSSSPWPSGGSLVVCDAALHQGRHELHIGGHEAVVGMDQLPSTAVQAGLLEGRQGGGRGQRWPVRCVSCLPLPSLGARVKERLGQRLKGSGGRRKSGSLLGSPPPQHPGLGGAGWARSAGSRVPSSDCRPTGSPATGREGDQGLSDKGAHTSIRGRAASAFPGTAHHGPCSQPLAPWLSGVPPCGRGYELNIRSRSHF